MRLQAMQNSLDEKEELRSSMEMTLTDVIKQERQLQCETEAQLCQEQLAGTEAEESLEMEKIQLVVAKDELQKKDDLMLSMKTSFEESLLEERQKRLSVEQTLGETNLLLIHQ